MIRLDRSRSWMQIIHIQWCRHSVLTKRDKSKSNYSPTLNLPQSNFPMKHGRHLELDLEKQDLFPNNEVRLDKPKFILHDGPPYANGDAHFGHAINRILKDILIKRKLLENFKVDYRPGWDCHGLPIELKALPEYTSNISPLEVRSRARKLAQDAIERQRRVFQQWFLSANWSCSYQTFEVEYCLEELQAFYSMYKKGLIFRDIMPVYWSPSTQTALAEAELQYKPDHLSRAAYICYPVIFNNSGAGYKSLNIEALIWTTTPWTLLANEAIAYSERLNYCLIRIEPDQKLLLVARENLPILQKIFRGREIQIIEPENICNLNNLQYKDPIKGKIRPFVPSAHVTSTKGTGLVHIAPNHGHEDYKLMRKHFCGKSFTRESIVDDLGQLRLPNGERLSIIDDNLASKYVLEKILPRESVLFEEDYKHSYPYDWRSSRPVLIRSSEQWFVNIDSIRQECLEALQDVRFYPELLRKEMLNQLMIRPNWCISRQRKYGVPIPVFYDRHTFQPVLNDQIFETILQKFRQEGMDVWWQREPSELLGKCITGINPENLIKSEDILDIWFDSGCSWLAVLPEPDKTSELYLEGIDQLRGWFQSSLITSIALRGRPPYRSILIHGFALDCDGHKMSKSLGNVIDPMDIVNGKFSKKNGDCGVDGLRFWIARYACSHNDVHVNLQEFQEDVLTILNRFRNTFRYILGYLSKYPSSDPSFLLKPEHYYRMKLLDKYLLYRILKFHFLAQHCYQEYLLGHLMESMIYHFLYEVSNFYLSRIKDRLYCDLPESKDVQSILTVLYHCYHTILFHMAPVLPHISIECHQNVPTVREGIIPNIEPKVFFKECLFPKEDPKVEVNFVRGFHLIHLIIHSLNQWAGSEYRLLDFDCHLSIQRGSNMDQGIWNILQLFQPSMMPQIRSDLVECLQVAQVSYGIEETNLTDIEINEYTDCLEIMDHEWTISHTQSDFYDFEIKKTSNLEEALNNSSLPSQEDSKCIIRILLRRTMNQKCPRCRRFTIVHHKTSNLDQRENINCLCDRCNSILLHN